MVVHGGLRFCPTISVCLSSNCEDLSRHIVFQMFLTIGTQPLWMLLTCSVTWVIVTWVTWMTLGQLTYIWHCAPTWIYHLGHRWLMAGRQDLGLFFCFHHTSDLNVWSWYIVNNKLMIWKIVLGLHSDRTTPNFLDRTLFNIAYARFCYNTWYSRADSRFACSQCKTVLLIIAKRHGRSVLRN